VNNNKIIDVQYAMMCIIVQYKQIAIIYFVQNAY